MVSFDSARLSSFLDSLRGAMATPAHAEAAEAAKTAGRAVQELLTDSEEGQRSALNAALDSPTSGRVALEDGLDAARRLRHPMLLEVRFAESDTDWGARIERLRAGQCNRCGILSRWKVLSFARVLTGRNRIALGN